MGRVRAEGDVDARTEQFAYLAGEVEHEVVRGRAPGHARPRPLHLLDVLLREADAVDQEVALVEGLRPLQYAYAVHALGVEAFFEVGDEGPTALHRRIVLDLDSLSPFQVEGGALVGEAVFPDDADGQAVEVGVVELVGEMVVDGADAGEQVLVGAEQVHLSRRRWPSARRSTGEALRSGVPGRPVRIETALGAGPTRGR